MRNVLTSIFVVCLLCSAAVANDQLDLSSPEATLAGYIESLRHGNVEGVLARYHNVDQFRLPGRLRIEKYEIVNKIIFGNKEVEEWNGKGIIPSAKVGDVQLDVRESIDGRDQMFSYNFRKIDGSWKLICHFAWGVD